MKLWLIHPKYLDQKSLKKCWQDTLAAIVLLGRSKEDQQNYPQLKRFLSHKTAEIQLHAYLYFLLQEALKRDLKYDSSKVNVGFFLKSEKMIATKSELKSERQEFLKIKDLDTKRYNRLKNIISFDPHPLFRK